jgi:mRNA-degrading endonuclease RelE of RelBE toxin-antitoxin system
MATVVLTLSASADFQGLPLPIQARVAKIVERLRAWPHVSGSKRLGDELAGKHRLRTGDYRVQFYVETTRTVVAVPASGKGKKKGATREQVTLEYKVVVEKIGHRDGFYDDGD